MLSDDLRPPPPPRTASSGVQSKVTFEGAQSWRESVAIILCFGLCISVFISVICLSVYVWRDKAVYEELIDYLDKTISISKINYNHLLGLYQLNDKEIEVLGDQRMYKTIIWSYLFADMGCYVFLVLAILIYYTTNVNSGTMHVIFWIILGFGTLYCICEVHLFSFMLFPYSATLPNATEQLLNHAIPHNPGGLLQMEQRLGCTFDHNLYAANKRRLNPRNSCDPQIESSFLPSVIIILLLVLRLLPIVVCALLLSKRTPLSESVAQLVEKTRPVQRKPRNSPYQVDMQKKSSALGISQNRGSGTPLPPMPSPSQVDHSISYNNAAYFATSSAIGLNSSRSSEISRIETGELFRPTLSHHASGSIQSEV